MRGDKLMDRNALQVVIADDEPITRMDLKELLESAGYIVVAEATDGFEAVEACKVYHPDLVLMDIKMPFLDGISGAKLIHDEDLAGTVILLTAYSERELIDEAKNVGVGGYLVKPIDEKSLIPSIELAVARSQSIMKLKEDVEKISRRLESRGIVERAKGLVMTQEGMTEQQAYDYIRKLSQEKSLSMRRVSEILLMKIGGK